MSGVGGRPDGEIFPLCDGRAADSIRMEAYSGAKLEFLAAYAEINKASAKLVAARTILKESERAQLERAALLAVEKALLRTEELADQYAPVGFYATPEFEDGVVKNVVFGHPGAQRRDMERGSCVSAFVTLMKFPF